MSQARQKRKYKFVFKRKIFIKEEDLSSDDEMFNRLIYLQAADEVIIGNIPVADENVIMRLVAGSIAVDLADEFPDQGDDLLEAETIMQDVVQRRRRVFGPAHPDTLEAERHLATVRDELAK